MFDALVIGAGPAGLTIAAALCQAGLTVGGIAPHPVTEEWPNTYGIWCDELESLNLTHLLAHRWDYSVSYFSATPHNHNRAYGLFEKHKLQAHLLQESDGTTWHQTSASTIEHGDRHSTLTTTDGQTLNARIVIDASGHRPAFIQRPEAKAIAYQAAYGIVGKFSAPPIEPNQFVLMDFRADHLTAEERQQPPTFLYAMDLGDDTYFVEETSLALSPAIPFDILEDRLHRRLAHRNVKVLESQHVEHCLFPMNLPLPDLTQPVVGFGGAASMVHPASGYMVGALLRRAPELAEAIAAALKSDRNGPQEIARQGWTTLWSGDRLRKHYLYLFGLEALMGFEESRLNHHFETFFNLPADDWSGFLADTLTTPELVRAMIGLFGSAPNDVRWGLMRSVGGHGNLLLRAVAA